MIDVRKHRILAGMLVLAVGLAACARPAITSLSERIPGANIQHLFVATMRTQEQTGTIFGEKRSKVMNYGSMDISVPSVHEVGAIERSRVGGRANPEKHFTPVDYELLPNVTSFADAMKSHRHHGANAALLYVHGYNNTLEDAAFRLAQIRADFGFQDPAILFSWPSAGDPRGYVYDRDSVLFARDDFEQLIRDLRARGQKRIFILAHSMGAYLTMEALRQIAIKGDRHVFDVIEGVVLMSPDIDPDVFRRQAEQIEKLPQPFVIMTSKEDKVLSMAGLLSGRKPRLGRIESAKEVEGLGVTVLDFSNFSSGAGHSTPVSSPETIRMIRNLSQQMSGQPSAFGEYVLLGKKAQN